jgi:Family of unknown function (DUF6545)
VATTIMILAGLFGLGTGGLKLRDALRHPEQPALRALCVMLGVFGLAFIATAPPVTPWLSGVVGIPNGGRLIGNSLTLISAAALQAMMLYLARAPQEARPRVRVRLAALAVCLVGMSISLLTAHTEEEVDFLNRYAGYPPITVYQLFYLSFFGLAVADLLHLSIRYSRLAEGALRWGMRLVAVGAVSGVFYLVYRCLQVLAAALHTTVPGDESAISTTLAGISGILLAVGVTMPLWGTRAAIPVRRARQYLAYRRLGALWQTLRDAVPEVALTSGQAMTGEYRSWQIGIRLYRRVIEIRDAQLVLVALADPDAVRQAEEDGRRRGLTGDRLRALIDAATLLAALRGGATGTGGRPAGAVTRTEPIAGEASLTSESRYLEKVAAAFHTLRTTPATHAGSEGR